MSASSKGVQIWLVEKYFIILIILISTDCESGKGKGFGTAWR